MGAGNERINDMANTAVAMPLPLGLLADAEPSIVAYIQRGLYTAQ